MRIQILILGFKGLNSPMVCLLNNDTFLNRPQSMRQGAEKPSRSDVSTPFWWPIKLVIVAFT